MAGLSQIYADGFARDLIPRSTAPTFLSSTSYAVGDYVYYQGNLYRCTTAHTGTWVASHFTAVTVGSELKAKEAEIADVKSDLSDVETDLSDLETTIVNGSDTINLTLPFVRGWLSSGEFVQNSRNWATEEYISTDDVDWVQLTDATYLGYVNYYDETKTYKAYQTITPSLGQYPINKTYPYIRVSLGFLSSSDVVPASALSTYIFAKNVASDKNIEITADKFTDMWVLGGINSSTGALNYGSTVTYISPAFISKKLKSVTPNTGYFVAVFAYADGGYVGVYNGSTFTTNYAVRTVMVDLDNLRETYPNYDFKLLLGNLNSVVTGIRENIVFRYDARVTNETNEVHDINRTLEQARNVRQSGTETLTLLHFSDIHGNADMLKNIIDFGVDYSAYINDIICTGDIVGGQFPDGIDFWTATNGAEKILTCIGNHDAVTAQVGGSLVSMSELCDTFITPFISNWGTVVHPSEATYYYKDYTAQKVRLIVLDVMHNDATQLAWLETALDDANTNDLHVVIAIHYPVYPRTIVTCDFSPAKDLSNYDTLTIPSDVLSAVNDFQTDGGTFICYLTGHEHTDFILTSQAYPNQLVISITCASNVYTQWYKSDQYRYNSFSDAFNLTTINTQTKTVSIKRVGADMDMFLRDRKTFSYDYGNHVLLN